MNEKKLISVFVPAYKTEKYIRQCVDSILNQTYKNLEIILVDDGSPDKCPEICDAYAKQDDRIIVIHQDNAGVSAARNKALDICRGDYISFVDSDDWLEPETYDSVMQAIHQHNVDVVLFAANVIESGMKTGVRFDYFPEGTIKSASEMMQLTLEDRVGGQVWMKVYTRKCWNNVRFPVGRIYEDLAISFKPFLNAENGAFFYQKALYNYRLNPSGISLSVNPQRNYNIFLAFRDHYEYAHKNKLPSEGVCLARATDFAIEYLNNRIRSRVTDHVECKERTLNWLNDNKYLIMACDQLNEKKRKMLDLYYFSPAVYRIAYKIFVLISEKNK